MVPCRRSDSSTGERLGHPRVRVGRVLEEQHAPAVRPGRLEHDPRPLDHEPLARGAAAHRDRPERVVPFLRPREGKDRRVDERRAVGAPHEADVLTEEHARRLGRSRDPGAAVSRGADEADREDVRRGRPGEVDILRVRQAGDPATSGAVGAHDPEVDEAGAGLRVREPLAARRPGERAPGVVDTVQRSVHAVKEPEPAVPVEGEDTESGERCDVHRRRVRGDVRRRRSGLVPYHVRALQLGACSKEKGRGDDRSEDPHGRSIRTRSAPDIRLRGA